MRRTTIRTMVAGVALVLGSVTAAQAADYCLEIAEDGDLLALKGFVVPGKGKCGPARGFYKANVFAGGSACQGTDGTALTFLLTATSGGAGPRVDLVHLDLPAGTGSGSFCVLDAGAGGACFDIPVKRIPCPAKTVPVP